MSQIGLARKALAKVLQRVPGSSQDPADYFHFPGDQLISILENQAVPAITAIAKTPGFQSLVASGIDLLLPGAGRPARRLIEDYQSEVRACCDAMQSFIASHAVLLGGHVPVAGSKYMRLLAPLGDRQPESLDTISLRIAAARHSSEQEWVWTEDFFGPSHGTYLDNGEVHFQNGEFVVSLNDDLTHVGNIVARCLMVRVDSVRRMLQEIDGVLQASLVSARCGDERSWRNHLETMTRMTQTLRMACLTDSDATLAEAAMALVQILLEFSAAPLEITWLPVPVALRNRHAGQIRHALHSRRDAATAERILDALKAIADWWEGRPSTLTALEEAIASRGLVLHCQKQEMYWEGRLVSVKWADMPTAWRFVLALAKSRGVIGVTLSEIAALNDQVRGDTAFSTLKGRVARLLPSNLRSKIVAVRGEKSYRLDLHSSQIHII